MGDNSISSTTESNTCNILFIPELLVTSRSNLHHIPEVKEKCKINLKLNPITSSPSCRPFTHDYCDINTNAGNIISAYNRAKGISGTGALTQLYMIPPPPGINFSDNHIALPNYMYFSTYNQMFNSIRDIYFSYFNEPIFSTNNQTYKTSMSEFSQLNLQQLVLDKYCENNHISVSDLDLDVLQNLFIQISHSSNLNNLSGRFYGLSDETLFSVLQNSFEFKKVIPNTANLTNPSTVPNVYTGATVALIHKYDMYFKIEEEWYLVSLKIPFNVVFTDYCTKNQFSNALSISSAPVTGTEVTTFSGTGPTGPTGGAIGIGP
jgi:hypothetical protein